jgi:hypothetical protein
MRIIKVNYLNDYKLDIVFYNNETPVFCRGIKEKWKFPENGFMKSFKKKQNLFYKMIEHKTFHFNPTKNLTSKSHITKLNHTQSPNTL